MPNRNNNNRRYSNAYERGFETGLRRAETSLNETNIIDQSTRINDTKIEQDINQQEINQEEINQQEINQGDTIYDQSFKNMELGLDVTNVGYIDSNGERKYHQRNGNSRTSRNGYIRQDNGREIQKPGYSYLDPTLWSVPRKRTPVCFSSGDMERKENSLDPAGFVFGGPSNVMEFHGVGSIMPKFVYREQVNQVEQPGDL